MGPKNALIYPVLGITFFTHFIMPVIGNFRTMKNKIREKLKNVDFEPKNALFRHNKNFTLKWAPPLLMFTEP